MHHMDDITPGESRLSPSRALDAFYSDTDSED